MMQKESLKIAVGFKIGALELQTRTLPAPLAGYTDRVFRDIARSFGCHLVFTEMLSAEGLIRNSRQTWNLLDAEGEDFPLGVQIFGQNENSLAEAARLCVDKGAALVDLNLGCPVRKIVRNGAGSGLLDEPKKVLSIVRTLRKAVPVALTIKMRTGTSRYPNAAKELAPLMEKEGADAVCIHPRTLEQSFGGKADWRLIGEIKSIVGIPVIGNGDILKGKDAQRMREETGCDGVMIGRASIGNPWIFEQARAALGELNGRTVCLPSLRDRIELALRHIETMVERKGEARGIKEFRKHAMSYLRYSSFARQNRADFFKLNRLQEIKQFLTGIAVNC